MGLKTIFGLMAEMQSPATVTSKLPHIAAEKHLQNMWWSLATTSESPLCSKR